MRGDTGGKRAGRQEESPHALRFPSQWNHGTISVELLSAGARVHVNRGLDLPIAYPHKGSAISQILSLI